MAIIGLVLIVLSWGVQFLLQKNEKISPAFLNLYLIGVILVVIDAFMAGNAIMAYLNLASFCIAALVLYRTFTRKD